MSVESVTLTHEEAFSDAVNSSGSKWERTLARKSFKALKDFTLEPWEITELLELGDLSLGDLMEIASQKNFGLEHLYEFSRNWSRFTCSPRVEKELREVSFLGFVAARAAMLWWFSYDRAPGVDSEFTLGFKKVLDKGPEALEYLLMFLEMRLLNPSGWGTWMDCNKSFSECAELAVLL